MNTTVHGRALDATRPQHEITAGHSRWELPFGSVNRAQWQKRVDPRRLDQDRGRPAANTLTPRGQPHQRAFPEQHQSEYRSGKGHAEHPRHLAGRSNLDHQRVEHHHRTILPVISLPALGPGDDRSNGIADLQLSAFLSPATPGHWIWRHRRDRAYADQQQRGPREQYWGFGSTFVSSEQLLDAIRAALRTKAGTVSQKCHLATPNIG